MLTLALYGLLAIVLSGGLYLVAAWLLPAGEQIAPPVRDEPIWELPAERALVAADITAVRLPVALRGYRFAETDLLLDRLVEELRIRDEEIARLGSFSPAGERTPEARQGYPTYHPVTPPEAGSSGQTRSDHASETASPPKAESDAGAAGSWAEAGAAGSWAEAGPAGWAEAGTAGRAEAGTAGSWAEAGPPASDAAAPDAAAPDAAVVPLDEPGGHAD